MPDSFSPNPSSHTEPAGLPRRILMSADPIGGVWPFALELIRGLGEHGVEVALATMGAPVSDAQHEEAAALANLALYESHYQLEWMEEPWGDVQKAGEWLLGLAEHVQPDVVHLNQYAHGALPWRAPLVITGHSCVLSWWHAVKHAPAPNPWNRYWYEVERGLQAARVVLAPTRAMLTALTYHYGPFARSRVIYNGRRAEDFAPGPKERLVFCAGRLWDEAKNVATLAEAAPLIAWPVYIAGEPRHPEGTLVEFENVNFLGHLEPRMMGEWFGHASIYALPARYEPFGLSVLEAALSGCALVLGDIATLRELWAEAALFVPPNDPAALAGAINTLIGDEAQRLALAEKARARALEFTPQRMTAGYLEAYQEAMRAQAPACSGAGQAHH